MNIWAVVLILLLLGVFGAPGLVVSHNYGYGPTGIVGVIAIVLLVLLAMGKL